MAASRAVIHLIRQRHILPSTVSISSAKTNLHYSFTTSQANYASQKSLSKTEQNESGSQVQLGFADSGKFLFCSNVYCRPIVVESQ